METNRAMDMEGDFFAERYSRRWRTVKGTGDEACIDQEQRHYEREAGLRARKPRTLSSSHCGVRLLGCLEALYSAR